MTLQHYHKLKSSYWIGSIIETLFTHHSSSSHLNQTVICFVTSGYLIFNFQFYNYFSVDVLIQLILPLDVDFINENAVGDNLVLHSQNSLSTNLGSVRIKCTCGIFDKGCLLLRINWTVRLIPPLHQGTLWVRSDLRVEKAKFGPHTGAERWTRKSHLSHTCILVSHP